MSHLISDKLKERLIEHLNKSDDEEIPASTPLSEKIQSRIVHHLDRDEKSEDL